MGRQPLPPPRPQRAGPGYDRPIDDVSLSSPSHIEARPLTTLPSIDWSRTGWSRLGWSILAAVVVLVGLWTPPAHAHSSLIQASPGFDAAVGGSVEFVELAFNEPVSDAVVAVSYNQEPVAGMTTMADGQVIRFEFNQPLELTGRYEVSYELISFDADRTTNTFFFTYELDAPPPVRVDPNTSAGASVGVTSTDSEGTDWLLIGVLAFLAVSVIGLLAAIVWRLDAKRQQESAT